MEASAYCEENCGFESLWIFFYIFFKSIDREIHYGIFIIDVGFLQVKFLIISYNDKVIKPQYEDRKSIKFIEFTMIPYTESRGIMIHHFLIKFVVRKMCY